MTLQDRIARFRDLIAQRDELDRQIAECLGDAAYSVRPTREEAKPRRAARKEKTAGKKRRMTCKNCGQAGHIAKTCKLPPAAAASPAMEKMLLTEDQFDNLKHLQRIGDLISKDFAEENGLALSEVNRAIQSRNFDEFSHF